MFKLWKSAAIALGGLSMALAVPAQARDRYYDRGGDDAAIAIGAGVVGLALGAALASSSRDRDYYYDDSYYYPRTTYYQSYPQYYQTYPRYYQNYNYSYPRQYYRRGYDGWRGNRHHGRRHHDRYRRY